MANPGPGKTRKKGKKNRKHGRNKPFCQQYKLSGREAKNKARNVKRELDRQAKKR
jgi:hypothetical protein